MHQIRYIFIFIVLVLAACAKVDVLSGDVMSFDVYTARSGGQSSEGGEWEPTKADETYVPTGVGHLPSGSSFGVFGFFHPEKEGAMGIWGDTNPNHPNIMYNQQVTVTETAGVYTCDYNPKRYWPVNEKETISFFAYYPYDAASGTDSENYVVKSDLSSASNGMGKLRYKSDEDPAKQADFLVSDLCANQSKTSGRLTGSGTDAGKVRFTFHHMLAVVRINTINVVSENPLIVPDAASFKCAFYGFPVAANCIPTPGVPAANGLAACTFTWDGHYSSVAEIVGGVPQPRDSKMSVPQYTGAASKDDFLLVIPHNVSDKERLEVTFDLARETTGNEGYSYKDNSLFALLNTKISTIEANKVYTFNITASLHGIEFDAVVTDWTTGSSDLVFDK